jgi:hypothetical protein
MLHMRLASPASPAHVAASPRHHEEEFFSILLHRDYRYCNQKQKTSFKGERLVASTRPTTSLRERRT